ncbi:cholinesterase [Biomphalaria glabrata]|nr:cholinesterase [Biomphalaria glabrata]
MMPLKQGLIPIFVLTLTFLSKFSQLLGAVVSTADVLLDLEKGQTLRGIKVAYSNGDHINKFYGIPYALPPTGDRRFEPPSPALPWSGVRNAKTEGNICPQNPSQQMSQNRSEDCLNLSVFSPNLNGSLPVFVWIHGGGFRDGFGSSDVYLISRKGMVSVAINYRLAPFGFLSTGDDVMPGNYGMLDQVLALKWVQKHIRAFGGDPSRVTIAGNSAGGHSVDFHILSPLSRGLFHRAIMESGTSFCSSAMERPGKTVKVKDFTLTVAASVGCTDTHSTALLRCLKSANADQLLLASVNAEKSFAITFIAIPRVETKFGFLPDYPKNLFSSGQYNKVDTLRGYNSGEWAFAIHDTDNNGITRHEFTQYFAAFFKKSAFVNDDAINQLVEDAYLGNKTDPISIRTSLVHALADMTYGAASLYDLEKTLQTSGATTRHFFYHFSYRGSNLTTAVWKGVAHAGEVPYVFSNAASVSATADDKRVGNMVQTMWTNFAKYGEPTPVRAPDGTPLPQVTDGVHWDSFTRTNQKMFEIGLHPKMEALPRPFIVALYQKVLDLMHAQTVVQNVVVG